MKPFLIMPVGVNQQQLGVVERHGVISTFTPSRRRTMSYYWYWSNNKKMLHVLTCNASEGEGEYNKELSPRHAIGIVKKVEEKGERAKNKKKRGPNLILGKNISHKTRRGREVGPLIESRKKKKPIPGLRRTA